MSWNYRLVREIFTRTGQEAETGFHLREIYYNDKGEPDSWADRGCSPYGESPEEVRRVLEAMLKALDKPTLDFDDNLKEI